VIELRTDSTSKRHARGVPRDAVAEGSEQVREETVAFVTESSASAENDLLIDPDGLERDLAAHVDVEVLKGYGFQEGVLERPKIPEFRFA
jgi:hypothetical protein